MGRDVAQGPDAGAERGSSAVNGRVSGHAAIDGADRSKGIIERARAWRVSEPGRRRRSERARRADRERPLRSRDLLRRLHRRPRESRRARRVVAHGEAGRLRHRDGAREPSRVGAFRLDLAALVSGGVASPAFVVESECHVNADPAHDQLIRMPKDRAAGTRGRARLPERLTRAARRGISVRAPAPVRRARDSNRSTA